MHISLGQKLVMLGMLGFLSLVLLLLFPWWLFLFALFVIVPLSIKILTL